MDTQLVEELFAETLLEPPHKRQRAITAANCSAEVKQTVSRLLSAHEAPSRLLNDDLLTDLSRLDPKFFEDNSDGEQANQQRFLQRGKKIKNYVIQEVVGQGGMSVVYRATQTHPIERTVAIKLIRSNALTQTTIRRFFREQQAAALVSHPNIATLYEVGKTDDGQPYAVMEFINGHPITTFCDKHQLNFKQRINVFLRTCLGLSHAHRHGIVHRDIKPDNILVTVEDRRPVPKLIDFGIAKIKRQHLKDNLTVTQCGQIIGSPRYMSPEQFDGASTVDRRTDVYSAALVLFELLAGEPYRKGDSTESIVLHARAAEPDLISDRVKTLCRNKQARPLADGTAQSLTEFLSCDVNWILKKALALNPEDRYPTTKSFAKDLHAALRGQPVSVSGPSWTARGRRWAKSHARQFWIASTIILLLVSGLGFYAFKSSADDLTQARIANTQSVRQTAAANDLIMKLLASERYDLTPDQFDLSLIPAYRSQYVRIKSAGGPQSKEDQAIYGILAVLKAMSGDFDEADLLLEEADTEHQPGELRQVRDKICEEYAAIAKVKLRNFADTDATFEKASQQMTLGRCYIVWGMLDDAKGLLHKAVTFFETHAPDSYECLVAKITLAKILEKSDEDEAQKKVLVDAYLSFKDNQTLLGVDRGQRAFASVVRSLAEIDPDQYGALTH